MTVTLDPWGPPRPFAVWDYCAGGFRAASGDFTVCVGTAADNTQGLGPAE